MKLIAGLIKTLRLPDSVQGENHFNFVCARSEKDTGDPELQHGKNDLDKFPTKILGISLVTSADVSTRRRPR